MDKPRLLTTRIGANLDELTTGELAPAENRIISGSVLFGDSAAGERLGYLGRFHLQVSVLREEREREQEEKIRIIDYQGSRLGSAYYDLASLLLDPYTNMPQESIEKFFSAYHTGSGTAMSSDESYTCFLNAGTQRLLQALGAYCNLSFHQKKSQFEQYIEPAIEKLCWVMKNAGLKNLYNLLKPYL